MPFSTRTVMTEEHEQFRDQVRRFVETEIVPFHRQWERDGIVPKELWTKAGELGFLCVRQAEKYGGAAADFGFSAVLIEEMARVNASGVGFSTHSEISAPYIETYGNEEQKARWLPQMARVEMICAIAMTEPGTGSDLKAMRTSARRDGDSYVINGQKTFITNGQNCGIVIVAAKTDVNAGSKGVSLICVEADRKGFAKGRNLEKIGMHAQDTSELFFEDVRVPVANRLGEENKGFYYLMQQLPQERLTIALRAAASVESMLQSTIDYTRGRTVFGQPLFNFQNTKFKLAEVRAYAEMLRVFTDHCLALHMKQGLTADTAAMAKLVSAEMQNRLLDELLQLHGGYGYVKEYPIGQAWVDARVMRIYAGTSEVMKEIISRTL